jgi:putative FmdB family regulatory protein
MPIYEYRCNACGHELETLQKFSDTPLSDCPSCTAPSLTKLVSAAGFQLKGSGWYATDFKGGGKPTPSKQGEDKPATAKSEANSEAKTDAAPAPACGSGACSACS